MVKDIKSTLRYQCMSIKMTALNRLCKTGKDAEQRELLTNSGCKLMTLFSKNLTLSTNEEHIHAL